MINYGNPTMYMPGVSSGLGPYPCSSTATPTLYEVQMLGKGQMNSMLGAPSIFSGYNSGFASNCNLPVSGTQDSMTGFFMQMIAFLLQNLLNDSNKATVEQEVIETGTKTEPTTTTASSGQKGTPVPTA